MCIPVCIGFARVKHTLEFASFNGPRSDESLLQLGDWDRPKWCPVYSRLQAQITLRNVQEMLRPIEFQHTLH
ncbi:hypothetical protein L596_025995 [Steinernema carpocapsae]|uniref:Uncharacterized protein n=1 Tax=Steinernema carpocapsae TaxID=34508 RepID=A0A4U5M029_STECR|nr:hypothetical protein L596_025995 [Steinernema carpocapsae]